VTARRSLLFLRRGKAGEMGTNFWAGTKKHGWRSVLGEKCTSAYLVPGFIRGCVPRMSGSGCAVVGAEIVKGGNSQCGSVLFKGCFPQKNCHQDRKEKAVVAGGARVSGFVVWHRDLEISKGRENSWTLPVGKGCRACVGRWLGKSPIGTV